MKPKIVHRQKIYKFSMYGLINFLKMKKLIPEDAEYVDSEFGEFESAGPVYMRQVKVKMSSCEFEPLDESASIPIEYLSIGKLIKGGE